MVGRLFPDYVWGECIDPLEVIHVLESEVGSEVRTYVGSEVGVK